MKTKVFNFVRGLRNGTMPRFQSYLKSLTILFGLMFSVNLIAEDEVYKTAKFGTAATSGSSSDYISTWTSTTDGFSVSVVNGNTNKNGGGWALVKFGRKNNASVGSITTSNAIDKAITKISIKIDAITASKITNITLYSGSAANSCTTNLGTFSKSVGTQSVTINSSTANKFYKIEFNCQSGSSNGLISISEVNYYIEKASEKTSVKYDANGKSLKSGSTLPADEKVDAGKDYNVSTATVAADGYKFIGWNTDKNATNGITKVPAITMVKDATVILYAIWKSVYSITPSVTGSGTIKFSTDGTNWSNSIADQEADADVYFKLVPNAGYEISGAPTLSTGGDVIKMDEGIYGFTMPASPVTISATFAQPAKYSITYDKGNFTSATGTMPSNTEVTPGTNYTVSTDELSLTGYTFRGWNTDKNATTGLTNITVNDDITLYAIFTINSYNVTFTPSITGGSIKVNNSSTSPVSVQYNSNVTITVTPTSKYFKLTTLTYNNADIKDAQQFTMPAENVEIAYSFTEDPKVTVTFKNNGETLATGGTREVYVNDPIGTLPTLTSADAKDAFSKTFVGWTESEINVWQDAAPTLITASEVINEAKTYHAVWAKQKEGGNQYKKITTVAELETGDYILAGYYSNAYYAMKNATTSSYYMDKVSVTPSNDIITINNSAIVWTLTFNKIDSKVTFYSAALSENNYLYAYYSNSYYDLGLRSTAYDFKYSQDANTSGAWKFEASTLSGELLTYYNNGGTKNYFNLYTSQSNPNYLFKKLPSYTDYITHSSSSPLASITLNTTGVKTNYFVGETFTSANLTATAKLDDGITFPIEYETLNISTPDLTTAGEKTVTVKYTFNNQEQQAEYKVNAYSVTVNSVYTDRVDDEPVTGNTYSWTPTTGALNFSTQAHYQFNGISELSGATQGGNKPNYTLSNPTANVTLTATWQRLFTLQYNSKGGAAVSSVVDVTKNTTVDTKPSPKYTGYNLVDWYNNEDYTGDAVTFPYAITKDETLYAKWEVKTTTITLSQTDATTKGTEEVVATWGQPMPEATMPQREHYQFAGYKHSSTLYYNADGTSAKNWDKEFATATLTAQWTINKNKVIFTNVLDGGTIKVNNQTSTINAVDYNSTVTITATPNAHYTLTALTWNGHDILSSKSFQMPDEDVTIAATFTEDSKVTVTFSDAIHDNNSDYMEYVGDPIEFPTINDETRQAPTGDCVADHYHFVGWTKDASNPNDLVTPASETAPATDITYYAVWAKEL